MAACEEYFTERQKQEQTSNFQFNNNKKEHTLLWNHQLWKKKKSVYLIKLSIASGKSPTEVQLCITVVTFTFNV